MSHNLSPQVLETIYKVATAKNVDPSLLASIAQVESSGKPYAARFEANWIYWYKVDEFARRLGITPETEKHLQMFSWGLTQVMGSVARECGFMDELPRLCDVETNLSIACVKIKKLLSKYNKLEDVVASYNAGIPRLMPNGKYFNQSYVNRVMANYLELKLKEKS